MSDQDSTTADPQDVDTDPVDDKDGGQADGTDQLGDAGKKALDAMKVQRAAARKERDAERARAEKAEAELAKLRGSDNGAKPAEVDEEAIRTKARAEAQAEVLKERALDKVEAKAARLFADPEDARALLAAQVDDFVDDGTVDTDAIEAALKALLAKKPHLAAQGGRRFGGGADGGARKGSTKPDQVTEQELQRMTPEQIVKARQEGRLADLL